MKPARIAIVFTLEFKGTHGAGRKAIFMANALKELGYDITIFTMGYEKGFEKKYKIIEIEPYKIEYKSGLLQNIRQELSLLRKYFFKIFYTILKNKYDIVQIHGATRAVPQLVALLAAKLTRAKIVYFYHDLLPETAILLRNIPKESIIYYIVRIFEKIMCDFSDVIIVVSDAMKLILRKRVKNKKIEVVYPTVNTDEFGNCGSANLREKYDIEVAKPVIIYVGKLEPGIRGLELLLEAFSLLIKKRNMEAYLFLVGGGAAEKELRKLAEKLGIERYVIFTGEKGHEEVINHLCIADIAVVPYPESIETNVSIPTKLLEYMASGKIIVASNLAQFRAILRNDAIYFKPNDVRDLAEKLEKAVRDINALRRIGENLKKKVQKFDEKRVKQKIKKMYLQLNKSK